MSSMELRHPAAESICVDLILNIQLKLLSLKFAAKSLFYQPSLLHQHSILSSSGICHK